MTRRTLRSTFSSLLLLLLWSLCGAAIRSAEPPAPLPAGSPADVKPATEAAPDRVAPVEKAAPERASPDSAAPDSAAPSAAETVDARAKDKETVELMKVFVDSLDQIDRNYVKPVNRRELVEAAIEGMMDRLDPYSSYIPPSDVERFRGSVENRFGGIGIQVSMEDRRLKIISPLVGTPAYRAGLMAGDTILDINGESIKGMSLDAVVHLLKGPIGTKLAMTVTHAGSEKHETLSMTREIVHVESVLGDRRKSNDAWDFMLDHQKRIGYIRISSFGRDTSAELRRALTELRQEKMRGLVLDLRFNPGGLLTSAIETCDLFIDNGRIVSTKGRNTPERIWNAKEESKFTGFPMAVLVNHYSASASEIVSACLQDHKRAVIVGQRTWGKGSVQNVIDLEGGRSVLKLTTASYWRPSGKNIHRFPGAKDSDEWGVKPDANFEVILDADETRRMVEDRRNRDIVPPHLHTAAAGGDQGAAPAQPVKPAAADAKTAIPTAKPTALPSTPVVAPDANPAPHEGHARAEAPVVDRQLKRALEYLDVEVARAG